MVCEATKEPQNMLGLCTIHGLQAVLLYVFVCVYNVEPHCLSLDLLALVVLEFVRFKDCANDACHSDASQSWSILEQTSLSTKFKATI